RDGVLGRVVGRDPLHRRDDDVASLLLGLLARLPLDGAGDADGVVLGLLADGLDELGLRVLGGQPAHAFEGGHPLAVKPGDLLAGSLDLVLAVEKLAVALLEHVSPLVELLVALEEPALETAQLGPLGPGLVLRLALEPELLVLRLEDEVLLTLAGL